MLHHVAFTFLVENFFFFQDASGSTSLEVIETFLVFPLLGTWRPSMDPSHSQLYGTPNNNFETSLGRPDEPRGHLPGTILLLA